MATRSDCVVFLNWFEYLRDVAEGAGVSVPARLSSRIAQARGYFEVGRYDTAYTMASPAVREFRTILKGERVQLKARCDALVRTITATLNAARAEGIGVEAFATPFNGALAMYNGEDFIASFHTLSGLAEDLSNYVSNARMGRWVDPLTGIYDLPEGTTDIITINIFKPESAGWAWVDAESVREQVEQIVRDFEGEVLEIRYVPPRMIIFVRGSPIFWVFAVLIGMLIFAFCAWAIGTFMIPPWKTVEETGKLQRHKVDLLSDYAKYLADKVASGELSPEVARELMDEYEDNMANIVMPEVGPNLMDYLMWIGIAGAGVIAFSFAYPYLKKALAKKEEKK